MITSLSLLGVKKRFARGAMPLLGALVLSMGCGDPGAAMNPGTGTGRIQGKLTDDGGDKGAGLAGSGTISSSATVRVSAVGSAASLQTLAEAKVLAGGTYALDLPADREKLVVQALDASGQVVGGAILEASGSAAQTVYVTPISAESSVEAAAFLEMVRAGVAITDADTADLRARIDARVTAAVKAAAKARGNADVELKALAQGIAAAQRTEIEASARAGVQVTQAALFAAEVQAAQSLSAALHAGKASAAAQADFLASLDAAAEGKGLTAGIRSEVEAQAGLAFRLTLKGLLDGAGAQSKATAEAAVAASASLQARLAAAALAAALKAQGAVQATQDAAAAAAVMLQSAVDAAVDSTAVVSAYQRFSATVIGTGDVQGSVMGGFLAVDVTTKIAAQAAVTATLTAAAALDVTVKASLVVLVKVGTAVDAGAVAKAVADAWATYRAAVVASAQTSLTVFTGKGATCVSLLITASGSFRAGT